MDVQLQGKRALVTGSSSGIGVEIAKSLAAEGVAVVVHGRDKVRTEDCAHRIAASGGTVAVAVGDLATPDGVEAVVGAALTAFTGIDILVNNAGGPVHAARSSWFDFSTEDWLGDFANNPLAMARLIKRLAPPMIERRWGRVIQISSRTATAPHPMLAPYAASKAAVTNLTVSLSKGLAGTGVTANTVSPGLIYTPGLEEVLKDVEQALGCDRTRAQEHLFKNITGQTILRFGHPQDVAWAVIYLASPLADFITGTNLHVNGGAIPTIN